MCGLTILLVTVFLGWLLAGGLVPVKTQTVQITANVLHDNDAVHISQGGKILATFIDVTHFKALQDKDKVTAVGTSKYNLYGRQINPTVWDIDTTK